MGLASVMWRLAELFTYFGGLHWSLNKRIAEYIQIWIGGISFQMGVTLHLVYLTLIACRLGCLLINGSLVLLTVCSFASVVRWIILAPLSIVHLFRLKFLLDQTLGWTRY